MVLRGLLAFAAATVAVAVGGPGPPLSTDGEEFDVRAYDYAQQVARCPALNRAENLNTEIDIHYVDVNPSGRNTILMVHGWPAIWASWKHQIRYFQDEFRVIAMDVRGLGLSSHPGDVESSGTYGDFADDAYCVLERAGVVGDVICLGHDWGTQICYDAARMRPDIIHGVIGLVVPYVSWAGPFLPIDEILPALPRLTYQTYFRDYTDLAVDELQKDVQRTLRAIYLGSKNPPPAEFLTSRESFLGAYAHIEELPPSPFFGREEEAYWVEQFTRSGFRNGLQFYKHGNRYASWKLAHEQGNFTVTCPALSILPTLDPVANWPKLSKLAKSTTFVPQLTEVTIESSHWPQLENPGELNEIMKDWLERNFGTRGGKRMSDEL